MGNMNLIEKALNVIGLSKKAAIDEKVYRAMIEYHAGGGAIPIPDNLAAYISHGYDKNLFVYMCVSYIARNAAAIPWKLVKQAANGEFQDAENTELEALIKQPNQLVDWIDYLEQAIGFYALTGNTYTYKVRVGANKERVKELYNLPSQYMEIVAGGSWTDAVQGYKFNLGTEVEFDESDVMHVKMPNYNWLNGQSMYGQSPLKAGAETLNKSNNVIEAQTKQAANGGAKGVLMYKGGDKMGGSPLSAPDMKGIERSLKDKVNNKDKRGSVAIMAKEFTYQQLGMSSKDMELESAHNMSRQDICALFGLSSILFNDNASSTYNNVQEAKKSAYTDTIIPMVQKFMSEFNRTITNKYDKKLKYILDTSGIEVLQDDMTDKAMRLSKVWQLTPNQVLAQLNLPESENEEMNKVYIPRTYIDLENIDIADPTGQKYNDFDQSKE